MFVLMTLHGGKRFPPLCCLTRSNFWKMWSGRFSSGAHKTTSKGSGFLPGASGSRNSYRRGFTNTCGDSEAGTVKPVAGKLNINSRGAVSSIHGTSYDGVFIFFEIFIDILKAKNETSIPETKISNIKNNFFIISESIL